MHYSCTGHITSASLTTFVPNLGGGGDPQTPWGAPSLSSSSPQTPWCVLEPLPPTSLPIPYSCYSYVQGIPRSHSAL